MAAVKLLLVGIGGFAGTFLGEHFKRTDRDYVICGMVDPAAEKSPWYEKLVAENVPLYPSMEAAYAAEAVDLTVITTPICFHREQILTALAHGSNVMCEKPLSGVSADAAEITAAAKAAGRFVVIGYQWSYAPAILALKRDIAAGLYGRPVFLKTMILWPRDHAYFGRGIGWAGRKTVNGIVTYDSILANAAAHYMHNMLYVNGEEGKAAEPQQVEAALLRANPIENFDTAVVRCALPQGGQCLFAATHAGEVTVNPCFEYRYEKGVITLASDSGAVVGRLNDGTVIEYGDPFFAPNKKILDAVAACREGGWVPPCGPETAAPHVRLVEAVQTFPIADVAPERKADDGRRVFVPGLDRVIMDAYARETLPDYSEFLS